MNTNKTIWVVTIPSAINSYVELLAGEGATRAEACKDAVMQRGNSRKAVAFLRDNATVKEVSLQEAYDLGCNITRNLREA